LDSSASPKRANASLITPCRRCSCSTWSITCWCPSACTASSASIGCRRTSITAFPARQITSTVIGLYYLAFFVANALVGWVGGFYSSLPTTTFWLIHVASAAFGLVAFAVFKLALGKQMQSTPADQAAALG
jgi:hypothetical protein